MYKVVMAGAFPPPMHGMAAVNVAVRDILQESGANLEIINLAAPSLERLLMVRLRRLPKVLRGLVHLSGKYELRGVALYLSISGGLGQLYELALIGIARLRGMRLFLHHHSFSYLDSTSYLTRNLIKIAGSSAVNITQSPRMAERLRVVYGAKCVVPISNAVFLLHDENPSPPLHHRLRTLGFMSNIAVEKGVFEFLDLMAALEAEGLPINAKLAGPFQDAKIERAVRARLRHLRGVEYVGAKYGVDKADFFATIDALIFPTLYKNETEGIVNHEAMSFGVPVIAYGRGCIPEIIGTGAGLVIDPAENFIPPALSQIKQWLDSPEMFQLASRTAGECFVKTLDENRQRWEELLTEILGGNT